jgi:hypothetical protein
MPDGGREHEDHTPTSRGDAWRAALLLLALLAFTQYDVIFLGRSLISTNYSNPLDWRPQRDNYGPDRVPHTEWTTRNLWPYANIRDAGATWWQWEPSTQFFKQAIRDREWPFWDPYSASGGTPAMANLVPAFFFPPYLVVVLFGASVALLNAYFLFLIWAPAFFTYLFVRRHDVAFWPAVTAGAAVMLGGATHQHVGTFIGQTAACLPFVMYATRCFFDRPTATGAVTLALAYATAALASFPPVLLAIFAIAALYGLVALTEPRPRWPAVAALWMAALVLSLGFVAFYYLPAFAARAATPQMSAAYHNVGLERMPVRNLLQIFSPTLMGGIQVYLDPPIRPLYAYVPYIGISAVALGFLARAGSSARRRTLAVTSVVALTLIVLKLAGAPVVHWVGALPVLNEIHIAQYFGIPVGFLIVTLAALGFQALFDGTVGPVRGIVSALATVAVPETLWRVAAAQDVFASHAVDYWLRDWWVHAGVALAIAVTVSVASVLRALPRARHAAAGLIVLLLVGDGVYMGWFPNPRAWSIFDHPIGYVRALQRHAAHDRIFCVAALNANLGSAFRLALMDSLMAFNPPRAFNLYYRYAKPPLSVFMREATALPPESVLDRANVGAIGVNRSVAAILRDVETRGGYESIFDDGFTVVFKRPTPPRFFFSSEYRIVSMDAALDAIGQGGATEIVLERDPGVPAAPNTPADPLVRIESYRRNSARVSVEAPRPGLLYASESFADGWTARVNGRPAEILAANYAFRAVAIPAGRAEIEFRYRPPGLTAGLAVSGASVLAAVVLVAAARITRRREAIAVSAPRTTSAAP